MEREWSAILAQYGQEVSLSGPQTGSTTVRAFLQPVLDRQEQFVPSPLGVRREERWLYLGPPEEELTAGETQVIWQGRTFEVDSARQVWAGSGPSHWWALLRPAEKEG